MDCVYLPRGFAALGGKGLALGNWGRYEEAIAAHDAALAIKPDKQEAWGHRGIALAKLERFEEALNSYNQVLAIKSDDDYAVDNKAGCHCACCYCLPVQVEPALENLEQAIRLNPDEPDENREMAKTDSDVDAIRDDPRFQALLTES